MKDIVTIPVGETIGDNNAVHINASNQAYKAILPDRPANGFCEVGGSSGSIQVVISGSVPAPAEANDGVFIYLDNETAGEITHTKPVGSFQILGQMRDTKMVLSITPQINELSPAAVVAFL